MKKKVSLADTVGDKSRRERLAQSDLLDKPPKRLNKKKASLIYLSEEAIAALDEIVYKRKKSVQVSERSKINKSNTVEQLILNALDA